jgi:predicted transcriptional regulator
MMEEYISELKEKDFIKEVKKDKGKTFLITEKGLKYLNEFDMIKNFATSFGLG